nr:NADH dehydrogenase subunit 1 [Scolopendra subspinipes]
MLIFLKMFYILILMVCVLVGVAFTILERKIVGYIQIRKGPIKVGYISNFQPFSDAISLFTSENIYPIASNFMPYCPVLSLLLSLLIWLIYPWGGGVLNLSLGMLLMISIMSMNVYPMLGCGWFSNSKYALLECLHSIAQTISYEVSLAVSLVCIIVFSLCFDFDFGVLSYYQNGIWNIFIFYFMEALWIVTMLAETNRAPFDFAEGESELVSGFNIEYSGGGFALIFMVQYGSILFISMLFALLFFGGYDLLLFLKIVLFLFFIFVCGLFPRFRYDNVCGLKSFVTFIIILFVWVNLLCMVIWDF